MVLACLSGESFELLRLVPSGVIRVGMIHGDVGDDASVMLGCDIEGAADGPAQVDAVHPRITGEADGVEVAMRLPLCFVESEEWQGADWCWHPASET